MSARQDKLHVTPVLEIQIKYERILFWQFFFKLFTEQHLKFWSLEFSRIICKIKSRICHLEEFLSFNLIHLKKNWGFSQCETINDHRCLGLCTHCNVRRQWMGSIITNGESENTTFSKSYKHTGVYAKFKVIEENLPRDLFFLWVTYHFRPPKEHLLPKKNEKKKPQQCLLRYLKL